MSYGQYGQYCLKCNASTKEDCHCPPPDYSKIIKKFNIQSKMTDLEKRAEEIYNESKNAADNPTEWIKNLALLCAKYEAALKIYGKKNNWGKDYDDSPYDIWWPQNQENQNGYELAQKALGAK